MDLIKATDSHTKNKSSLYRAKESNGAGYRGYTGDRFAYREYVTLSAAHIEGFLVGALSKLVKERAKTKSNT